MQDKNTSENGGPVTLEGVPQCVRWMMLPQSSQPCYWTSSNTESQPIRVGTNPELVAVINPQISTKDVVIGLTFKKIANRTRGFHAVIGPTLYYFLHTNKPHSSPILPKWTLLGKEEIRISIKR